MPGGAAADVVQGLTGVYHADGGWRGELAYVVGKIRGTAHCALCDVTHSPVRRKAAWDAMCDRLGVPFDLVHLDERSPEVLAATGTGTPAVLAYVGGTLVPLLGPDDLEVLDGSVDAFFRLLMDTLDRAGLRLPADVRHVR